MTTAVVSVTKLKTLRQEILQFLRNNQGNEFKIENITDFMWERFSPTSSGNGYPYFVKAVQHETDDLVKKQKLKKNGEMYSV